jgi:hypothetical protein
MTHEAATIIIPTRNRFIQMCPTRISSMLKQAGLKFTSSDWFINVA